jgi:hypothetical protein
VLPAGVSRLAAVGPSPRRPRPEDRPSGALSEVAAEL